MIEVFEDLRCRELPLISLRDPIATNSPGGQFVFQNYFQIGSRRTLYKNLRFAGCKINEKPALPAAKPVDKALT